MNTTGWPTNSVQRPPALRFASPTGTGSPFLSASRHYRLAGAGRAPGFSPFAIFPHHRSENRPRQRFRGRYRRSDPDHSRGRSERHRNDPASKVICGGILFAIGIQRHMPGRVECVHFGFLASPAQILGLPAWRRFVALARVPLMRQPCASRSEECFSSFRRRRSIVPAVVCAAPGGPWQRFFANRFRHFSCSET